MQITTKKLRRIIREALILEQDSNWKPSYKGYHPLFAGSYAGNGWVEDTFEPARGFFEANPDNEHFAVALEIMDRRSDRPPYFPFGFANALMDEISKVGGLDPEIISRLEMNMLGTDNEYMVAYTDW